MNGSRFLMIGIKIINEPVSGNQVYPKFIAAMQGQKMPDIAEAYSYHPLQFAALDQMAVMDDMIADWEADGRLGDIVNEFAFKKFFWIVRQVQSFFIRYRSYTPLLHGQRTKKDVNRNPCLILSDFVNDHRVS